MNKILYKYFPPERTGFYTRQDGVKEPGFFPDLTISFTAPSEFNDPFECEPLISTTKDEYIAYLRTKKGFEGEMKAMQTTSVAKVKQRIRSEISKIKQNKDWEAQYIPVAKQAWEYSTKRNVRILSLSKTYDNLLMWAHYAKNHKGFVVGIKKKYFEIEEKGIKQDGWGLRDVDYKDSKRQINPYDTDKALEQLPFYEKSTCWRYEEEVRFVGYDGKAPKFKLQNISPEYIESIRFGLKMSCDTKKEILNFCKNKLPDVKCYNALQVHDKYLLEFDT